MYLRSALPRLDPRAVQSPTHDVVRPMSSSGSLIESWQRLCAPKARAPPHRNSRPCPDLLDQVPINRISTTAVWSATGCLYIESGAPLAIPGQPVSSCILAT